MAAGSSDSVVELCTLADAELDAATSAKFFRDDDGPGGAISSFSWPEAGRTSSRLFDQSALQALCEKYKVPAEYTPVCLDGRWMACQTPPEDTIFVYADALEAGMRIPLHDFYVEVLGHYGLAPSQLEPDAWRYMAAFLMLSMDADVEPSLPAFRSFFSICTHDGGSVGWHHFRSRPGSCLFNVKVPGSPDPDPEWKSRFFLLRSPSTRPPPWPCAVKWGKPSKAAVRMPVVTGDTDMVMKKLQDSVMLFLSRSRLSLPVAPQQVDLTITPQQNHKLVKVGAGAAGAAAEPPPPPPPTTTQEPTRKRKSYSDTHTLVDSIAEALELAKTAMAELDEQGNELLATRAEVALLKEALAEVRRLADEASTAHVDKVKAECASVVANLKKQHAAAVARLKEEHAADVAGVKDAADKEVRETKKKMVLRLFPKLDVSLLDLEGPKLKGDPDAAGTPKGE
ncbi:hypothetical protein SORBI_3006G019000 [Sorghum bicolor]|uniref:Transposase (putative) gypsy type domain-containing protein n=1 Tax=Sorghum bicolor TaxID=4558 RepID=A0A1Z5RBK9_SORBI|nr:hypothetical protein SORBI_3006G019000 [Sorghum bicolor]